MNKKLISFLVLLIYSSIFFGFYIDYDSSKNANFISFETESNFQYYSNDTKTIYKIVFMENLFEDQNIKIKKGPIKEIVTSKNTVTIKLLYPAKSVELNDDKIIFYGYSPYQFQNINFEKLKLKDAIEMIFNYAGWNWIKTSDVPDVELSFNTNEIHIEYFLRMLEDIYKLNIIFYDKKTVLVGKSNEAFENDLPIIVESKTEKQEEFALESSPISITKLEMPNEKVETKEEEQLLFIESDYDLNIIKGLFNCKVASFGESYYAILAKEREAKQIIELVNFLDNISKSNKGEISQQNLDLFTSTSVNQNLSENTKNLNQVNYIIVKSNYDLSFLTRVMEIDIYNLGNNLFFLNGNFESLQASKEIIELLNNENKDIERTFDEGSKNESVPFIKKELVVVPFKISEIFDKILVNQKITFQKIDNYKEKVLYSLEFEEDKQDLIENIIKTLSLEEIQGEIYLKDLLFYVGKSEKINVICDFEENKKVMINNFNLNMSTLMPYLVSQGIIYDYIEENTIRFFENKKLLKYETFVFSGQNIDKLSIEELYLLIKQRNGIIESSKDSAFLVSNPVVYVNEGETASIRSVLSVPIFDEEGKISSKIESGFKIDVKGDYNHITKMVDTTLEVSISELKNQEKNIVDERSIKSNFIIPNSGFIKLGGLNFTNTIKSEKGIPILKNIPVIGKLFSTYDTTENIYDLVILIHVEVLNQPDVKDHY
ncbi:hypothetical protein [Petrotoga sp. 9PWA.NaAc.5.4]|uniref:hypothetical protein n=1 Tax=Petrotoga sp. 9PWA.NaAc.5.4 TaxID=1434328 RepID=UPI000CBE118C|nr:hypothetical protein [Petrotoga sp. 9PWA.NaAc.5.4]PNR96836.1 hypothetical protein X924_02205 [Petrotoga sp. 9PWA.NaAc.5.4]